MRICGRRNPASGRVAVAAAVAVAAVAAVAWIALPALRVAGAVDSTRSDPEKRVGGGG